MNPFTKDVINATMPGMIQANALSQNQAANSANSANAFGGSRQGIQQGVAQAQGAMNVGQMLAGLNSANFTQAQAAATGDISRNLTAQRSNQSAQQAKINSDIAASQGLTGTGQAMNQANTANFNMLQSAGASQSMQAQNEINAQMAKFNQAFNYPQQQLGTLESSLGMTPHDTSTAGQTTSQTTTPTDWASIISKGAGAAADLYGMSDRSMKTDIAKVDTHPSGLPIYSYRYKGDPKTYPKVMGPMAEDVAKIAPAAVQPMGTEGRLSVNMNTLNAFTPPPSPGVARGIQSMSGGKAPMTPPSSPGVAKGIAAMSSFMPPVGSGKATTAMRAGARGITGALANTKLRSPKIAGGLSA